MAITKKDLIDFEEDICKLYCDAQIKAPIHLSDGNEDQLIELFKKIDENDWVFSNWRSHYHALLHGVDREWLRKEIIEGNSITINNPEKHFFSSALVGGTCPIALGTALALKKKKSKQKVWVFVGDMTSETGAFHESLKYAQNHDLPIIFVIEDNGQSVGTPTKTVWGMQESELKAEPVKEIGSKLYKYSYIKKIYPHVGAGKWVRF